MLKKLDDWETPLKLFLDFPVYAFGYNWILSNEKNGEYLSKKIDKILKEHSAKQVIIITHSMGGLVARAASDIHKKEDTIWGIIHAVQPTLGAVDTYRNLKAGQWVDPFGVHLFEALLAIPENLIEAVGDLRKGRVLKVVGGKLLDEVTGKVIEAVTGLSSAGANAVQIVGEGFIGWGMDHGTAQIIGSTGQLISAVMYHCVGGLEMLPSKFYHVDLVENPQYGQVKDWLSVVEKRRKVQSAGP